MNTFFVDQESAHPIEKDFAYNNNVANSHVTIRLRFLRKVYGILFIQLLITSLCGGTMMALKPVLLDSLQQNPWVPFVLFISTFAILISLMWKRQETPTNFILLFLFTLCESVLVGYAVITFSATVVLQAFGLTTAVVLTLMLYTLNSKRDFSKLGVGLSVGFLVLLLAGPINLFLGSSLLEFSIAVGGTCLFSLFIVYDTWRIMYHCSPEEYIIACIDLYLDILNLFMYILRFLKEVQQSQS
ncbi:unnamed protein product [Heterobilharzia americana]|nr:unnamed protein product [Heterobilharzia americana]